MKKECLVCNRDTHEEFTEKKKLESTQTQTYTQTVSPFEGLEKAVVLQEARKFNEGDFVTRRPAQCRDILTKLLYLLYQNNRFTSDETTKVFFGCTKLFQSKNPNLRRMLYLFIKELAKATQADEVIIVIQSLVKDMNSNDTLHAANAIREKNQSLKFLQLSSRIDAVASRVETAVRMNTLTKDMIKVTKGMKGVLRTMNPERISKVMDKFERQFEDLDVVSAYQENAMDQNSSMTTPEGEVDTLMQQVADEHGLAVADQIQAAPTNNPSLGTKTAITGNKAEDDLARRLAALKAPDN